MRHAAAVLCALLVACAGPKPQVDRVQLLAPAGAAEPWRVAVTVRNRGGGEGEVALTVRLVERAKGTHYQGTQKLQLKGDETVQAQVRIDAPPGDYEASAEVEYPPR